VNLLKDPTYLEVAVLPSDPVAEKRNLDDHISFGNPQMKDDEGWLEIRDQKMMHDLHICSHLYAPKATPYPQQIHLGINKHIIACGLCPGVLLIKSKALNESSLPCGITFPWAPKIISR